ncbi:MAG: Hsp20/alpha crystallin family protein [Spirochaetota bacterium]
MDIRKYDPFDMLDRMADAFDFTRDIDRWFDWDLMRPSDTWGLYEGDWSPRLDVFENDDAYFIKMDVPGVEQKDIELNVTNDVLTIKGQRKSEAAEDRGKKKGDKYQREERMYGSFHRTIPLPSPVDTNNTDAKLRDGVLYITLPKKEETKPKKINVNVS